MRALWAAVGVASVLVALGCEDSTRPPRVPIALTPVVVEQSDATLDGQWSASFSWPFVAIHMAVLPNGRVISWPGDDAAIPGQGESHWQVRTWDPTTGNFTRVPLKGSKSSKTDIFCSGHTLLPDGRLLVAGGHIDNGIGDAASNVFDYRTNNWSRGAAMNAGRWYPTTTSLPNGEILVVAGTDGTGAYNTLPQVWTSAGSWRNLTGAQLAQPYYPFMHVAPDGRVFNAGPEATTRFLSTAGIGAWSDGPPTMSGVYRDYGSSVMYEPGKLLLVGGGNPPTNSAEVIDLNTASAAWRSVAPMAFGRRQLNATVLADGKVLVTGGTSSPGFQDATDARLEAELWDPATETWSTVASQAVKRLYHTTTVLLPDARVLTAGGGRPPPPGESDNYTAEIYSPPYLFNGARPSITAFPANVAYGGTFSVSTSPAPAAGWKVSLVRLSSVTHAFNQNQRFMWLNATPAGSQLSVTAPAGNTIAPPGHYLLFVLNAQGVPSVAKIVKVG